MQRNELAHVGDSSTRLADRAAWLRDRLGWSGLLLFSSCAWLSTTIAHIALAILALMTIAQGPATWQKLSRDPLVRLFGLFLIYLTTSAAWAAHQWPETAHEQWSSLWPWCSLWLFFIVGWWLYASWARVAAVLALAPLGLVISIVRCTDWTRLPTWLSGERYEFGYTSLGLSFLCVVIVLGLLAFLPRIANAAGNRLYSALCTVLAIGALFFFLLVLLVAQSRGAWLSLALGLIGFLVIGLWLRRKPNAARSATGQHRLLVPVVLCVVSIAGLWGFFGEALEGRFASEADVLPALLTMDVEKLPYSNGPARIHLAAWGLRMFGERPVFGWGPGTKATAYLAEYGFHDSTSGFLRVIRHFEHLHDVYIEILVRFGVVGTTLFVAAFVLICRRMAENWNRRLLPDDFFAFAAVVIVTTAFSGLYEFRILHTDFRFFALLFGGAVYTFALHRPDRPSYHPSPGPGTVSQEAPDAAAYR